MKDVDSMEECEGVGYGGGLLARALHRLCGTWCALRRWSSAGHVKKVVDKDGFFITADSSVDGGVRLDECGLGEGVLFGGDAT